MHSHQRDVGKTRSGGLKQLRPSELTGRSNTLDDYFQRAAEVALNHDGWGQHNPNSHPNGYTGWINDALQLYGAPPLLAQTLLSRETTRDFKYCNSTIEGSGMCQGGKPKGVEHVHNQWQTPYAGAGDCGDKDCADR